MKKRILLLLPSLLVLYLAGAYYYLYKVFNAPSIEKALLENPQLKLFADPKYITAYTFSAFAIQIAYVTLLLRKKTTTNLILAAVIINFILSLILVNSISSVYWNLQQQIMLWKVF